MCVEDGGEAGQCLYVVVSQVSSNNELTVLNLTCKSGYHAQL